LPCAEPANLAAAQESVVKLVLFQTAEQAEPIAGLMTERGVVSVAGMVESSYTPQLTMQRLIDAFDELQPALERAAAEGEAVPLGTVRLRAPLPRPGKILCCIANYWEHAQREARPLNMFLKIRRRLSGRATRSYCPSSPSHGSLCTKPSWHW
jgi:2-keto-4-pentenoate hydratase/2-oxohepta-3-ene-1,7-dioic acid hydratase in catechol pathway